MNIKRLLPFFLLLIFAMLLFWPLCLGRTLYWGDILLYFAPMLQFEQGALQQGHIPLWNPNILCGQPFVGNPQLGVFYPGTLLLAFLPVWLYLNIMIIGHVFLGGAAMTWYLKRWVRDPFAALIGGMVFMGSEYIVGRAQFPPMIFTAVYFPLILRGLDSCLDINLGARSELTSMRATWLPHIYLALIAGLMVLAAHPQMGYLILLFSEVYLIARLYGQAYLSKHLFKHLYIYFSVRRFLSINAAILLGLLLTSVQTLPALQLLLQSPRQHLSNAQANRFLLEPSHLLTLLWPRYYGHPASSNYWGGGNAWEPAFFVGWIPLILSVIAIANTCSYSFKYLKYNSSKNNSNSKNKNDNKNKKSQRKFNLKYNGNQKRLWFWTASCLIGVWLSLGSTGGLYWLAFTLLPGLSNFHDPARFLLYTVFSLAVLTTFGWDVWVTLWTKRIEALSVRFPIRAQRYIYYVRPACSLMIALPLLFFANDWNPTASREVLNSKPTDLNSLIASTYTDAEDMRTTTSGSHTSDTRHMRTTVSDVRLKESLNQLSSTQGRISLAGQERVWKHFITEGYTDYSTIRADAIHSFLDTMLPNIGINDGLVVSSGYEPVPVSAPSVLNDLTNTSLRRNEPNLTRLLALLDVRSFLFDKPVRVFDPGMYPFPLNPTNPTSWKSRLTSWSRLTTKVPSEISPVTLRSWQNRYWLHTAWVVTKTHRVEGMMRINAALTAPDFDPLKLAILCDAPKAGEPDLEWGSTLSKNTIEGISIAGNLFPNVNRRGTDEVQITVQNDIPNALLIFSSTAYPGWTATDEHISGNVKTNSDLSDVPVLNVSNRKIAIHRVDGALMGIYLNQGQHRIVLKYVPASYRIGLYVTMAACSLICFGLGISLTSKSHKSIYAPTKNLENHR